VAKSYKRFVGYAKYLRKEDIPAPINTSILSIKEEEVTTPGKGTQKRLVLYFDGLKKGLVLNQANADAFKWQLTIINSFVTFRHQSGFQELLVLRTLLLGLLSTV
jgi:hypothetical protein